jgi:enoyl-CoA hydratase
VVSTRDELMAISKFNDEQIVSKSPIAVANTITSVNAGFGQAIAGYKAEAENFAGCAATDDFKEGTTAFIEKRSPKFTGK